MINKICSVVSELDERLNAWKERLSELKTDLAAQEKMAVEPFAKQEELDKKRGVSMRLWKFSTRPRNSR